MEGFIVDDDEMFKSAVPRILRAQSSSPALLQKQVHSEVALLYRVIRVTNELVLYIKL